MYGIHIVVMAESRFSLIWKYQLLVKCHSNEFVPMSRYKGQLVLRTIIPDTNDEWLYVHTDNVQRWRGCTRRANASQANRAHPALDFKTLRNFHQRSKTGREGWGYIRKVYGGPYTKSNKCLA